MSGAILVVVGRLTLRGAMGAALSMVTIAGCASGDTASDATSTEPAPTTTGASSETSVTSTTTGPGPDLDPCALVTRADLAGLGAGERVDDDVDLDPTVGSVACRWSSDGNDLARLTVVVETPAFSDVFELAAADPAAEDPEQIEGLGDQAAYADILSPNGGGEANWLLMRSDDVVIRLASSGPRVVPRDELVAIGRTVLDRVTG